LIDVQWNTTLLGESSAIETLISVLPVIRSSSKISV